MLPDKIMHQCVIILLNSEKPTEESVESICKLLTTIGKNLDSPIGKAKVDEYFVQLAALSENKELPSRVRFMCKDVIELRHNGWVSRRKETDPAATRAEGAADKEESTATPSTSASTVRRSESKEQVKETAQDARSQDVRSQDIRHEAPAPAKAELRASRENVHGGQRRGGEWEGGRGKAKYVEKKPAPIQTGGWETVGGRGGRFEGGRGRGRGQHSPTKQQYSPVKQTPPAATKDKEPLKPKGNIFNALTDETTSSGPRSALRGSRGSPAVGRREVTIQEPGKSSEVNFEGKTEMLLEEYWSSGDQAEAQACIEELNAQHYYPEVIKQAIVLSLDKKDREREDIISLFNYLSEKGLFSQEDFIKGFTLTLEVLPDIEPDIPFAPKYVASYIANALAAENGLPISFLERALTPMVPDRNAATLAVYIMSGLRQLKSDSAVVDMYKSFDFMGLLPKEDRNEEFVHTFLVQKGAGFIVGEASEPNTPSSLNTSVEDDVEDVEPFQLFIMQQGADGSWKLNAKFADTLGFSYEEVLDAAPPSIREAQNVWATILALKFLEITYGDLADKWELLAKKATSWLSNEVQKMKLNMDDLEPFATKLLK